jgi:hypothetical protein
MRGPRSARPFVVRCLASLALVGGVLALTPAPSRAQCAAPDFKLPPATTDVGGGPRGIAVLDVKRDGRLDVVTTNATADSVTFALGDGSGGFTGIVNQPLAAGAEPVAVTVADFDRDGVQDLAVANRAAGTLQAVLLDAAGAVKLPLPNAVTVAANPWGIAAGDFDRDGIPDLVSASADPSGTVEFHKGNGDGTFTSNPPTGQATVGGAAQQVVAGDFNRDGALDVAVVAQHVPANPAVHLVLGNGSGGWLGVNSFPVPLSGLRPVTLAAGDVDNDGDLDVVTADTASTDIVALLGDGLGNLVAQPKFASVFGTTSVTLADFDGDGILDLGVARELSGGISVFTGDGLGGFAGRRDFAFTDDAFGLAAGDFDGDGRPDLAGSSRLNNKAVLLVNAFDPVCPKASFARAGRLQIPLGGGDLQAIVSDDWDGDAAPDLAIAGNTDLSILMGNGTLQFASPTTIALPSTSNPNNRRSLVVADFNLDSRPDLATVDPTSGAANDDSVAVLLNTGSGTFAPPLFLPVGPNPLGVVAGDFNGDGAPDLVSADSGGPSLTFLPGRGDGTFGAAVTTPVALGGLSAIAAADIDGDLVLDVAVTHTAGNWLRWYKGNGDGTFTLAGSYSVGNYPVSVALGDLNGDGRPDLAVANSFGNSASVLLNTGGAFSPATTYPVGAAPGGVRIGPADGDGDADLAVPAWSSYDVTVLLNDGTGAFPASTVTRGYNNPVAAIFVDADRNGKPDLAVVNNSPSGGLVVLPGDGGGGFGPLQISPGSSTGPRGVVAADFNRDGKPDLVTLDGSFDPLSFFKGQGDGTFAPGPSVPSGLGTPRAIGVGDFDSNGTLDMVVGGTGLNFAFVPGDGAGGFLSPSVIGTSAVGSSRRLAVGDFDRDGHLDFVRITGGNAVTVQYGDGLGGFVTGVTEPAGTGATEVVALDFTRDGILDLAITNSGDSTISLLEGRATRPAPWTPRPSLATDASPTGLATGDFDGDGIADLIVGQLSGSPGKMGYFRGTGTSPFFAAREDYTLADSTALQPDGVAAADVNGDGRPDALVACRGGTAEDRASVRVLLGTGDPTPGLAFQAADVWVSAQRDPSVFEIADFDRDGKPDFTTAETGTPFANTVAVVLNSNCKARRLRPNRNVSVCNTPSVPFGMQPAIQVEDDGANPIQCDAASVTASIVPGTGTPGAILSGENPRPTTAGIADWSAASPPLSVDLAGKKYRLEFSHPDAGLTFSRTFSQAPSLAISGPASFCASSSGFFATDPGFDLYRWYVDGLGPASFAASLTTPPGSLLAGPHGVAVDAFADTCPASASQPFDVFGDLASVVVTPGSPVSVCATCTGPTLTAVESGGGLLSRKWGYRTTAGAGPLTYIAAQTGTTYALNGIDFPGQGTYYLVEETIPQCGVVTESNEVEVQVTTATPADVVPVFTVRSTTQLNRLEWVYPPGLGTVAIRYRTSPTWLGCVPPEDVSSGFADIPDRTGTPGGEGRFDHGLLPLAPLVDDTTYCYSIFAQTSPSPATYATTGRSVRGRPFDNTTGLVKWAFSMGTATLSPPGLGVGVLHAVSNDDVLHSMDKGALGGSWPASWMPYTATGPSQSRPVSVPLSVGPATSVVYLGSQATAGDNAVAVDADTGLGLAGQPLGKPVQAGPAAMFTAYGGSLDAIFLGTRDSSGPNDFHALDRTTLMSLGALWPYSGDGLANQIGIVSAQAAVDYVGGRVFFTSYQDNPGVSDSVWCVDLATAGRCSLWTPGVTAALGDVAASPTLRGNRLYVSPIVGVDGEIEALSADDGTLQWASPFAPGDGQVKLFMVPDNFSTDLYFSTTTTVWSIRDDGAAATENWRNTSIPGPSQPVFYAGTARVYVGGADGKLHVLKASDGTDDVAPITLGDGLSVVGAPTVDQAGGFVYVGTDAGVVYAVSIP